MQFRRIAVRNFRKLASPVALDDIGDGVTVIAGDNEEGKSTLLEAIRAGLFQRHNVTGRPVEDMQPFGSKVRPEIGLDFEANGARYRIEKEFGQKPAARLTTPDGRFEGSEAEEHLAELLNFRIARRGASGADDWGVLGLFWLEQGAATGGLGFGETGRATLRGALEDEVGDVLGGTRGRALLDAARVRRGELLTATGRQRGELAEAVTAVDTAEETVQALERARAEYDREIDELERVRRELARIDADRVIEAARKSLGAAQAEAGAIEALRSQVESAAQARTLAEANATNAEDRWQQRQALVEALHEAERREAEAAAEHARLQGDADAIARRLDAAGEQLAAAAEARARHERRLARAETAARMSRLENDNRALREKLAQVEQLGAERDAARRVVNGIRVDQRSFDALQALDTRLREARAALHAVATRLRFDPEDGRRIVRDTQAVPAGETVEVTRPTRFSLEGFGTLTVEPGASDLAQRHEQCAAAEQALAKAIGDAGADSLDDSRALLARRAAAEATIQQTTRVIDAHAPDGEGALRAALTAGEDALTALRSGQDAGTGDGDDLNLEEAEEACQAARAAESEARDAREAARQVHQEHATRLALAAQRVDSASRARHDAAGRLQATRDGSADAALALALETARAALERAEAAREASRQRLAEANPRETELRRRKAEAALEQVRQEQARLREQAIALESHLSAIGRDGIGEQLEEARGALARATGHRDRLLAESAAWDLLVDTLERAERDAKEAFLGPVLEQVDPFLQLLLPGTRVSLDEETLEITGVTRDGRHEPFVSLSAGTREQIAILVRLAFAVYLREKDFPAAVILDDALVYADDDRFERMQLALHKAAESVQILILTCRPRDWRQFGAPIRRLADARADDAGPS